MLRKRLCGKRTRRGAMAVLIAFSLPVILILVAFAIQTTYHQLTRTELRTVVDAAAEAAARTLSDTGNQNQAIQSAKAAAARNHVGGESCTLYNSDIVFGEVARAEANGRFTFTPSTFGVTGVRVTASEQRPYVFPILRDILSVRASAVAGQTDRDIVLVIDRSGSMVEVNDDGTSTGWAKGDPVPPNSRWVKLVRAAGEFLDELEQTPSTERVALVTYNGSSGVDNDLIVDYQFIRDSIDDHTGDYEGGATNIAAGIESARQILSSSTSRSWATKTIVLMTDGKHNRGTVTPEEAAITASGNGMIIHTLTYGDDADTTQMETVSRTGGGSHWHAPNGGQLQSAFREIANTIPTMLME